jgi:hypothetical protein
MALHVGHSRIGSRTAGVVAITGAIAAGFGVLGAPSAVAGPAPTNVEVAYLKVLTLNGVDAGEPNSDRRKLTIQMGYLVCYLNQAGGAPQPGTRQFLDAAQGVGLCDYTPPKSQLGTTCPRTGAMSIECTNAITAISNPGQYADAVSPPPLVMP